MTETTETPSILEDPRWVALSEKRQDELLEEHRDDDVDHGWWEFTYEDFKEKCTGLGLRVDDISFSGFFSQGDGACFSGHVNDWSLILPLIKRESLLSLAQEHGWSWGVSGRDHHYCHAQTMGGELDAHLPDNPYSENDEPLQHDAWNIANPVTYDDLDKLNSELTDYCRELANELYHDLEREHDYLTDDEQVVGRLLETMSDEELADPDDEDEEDAELDETDHTNQREPKFDLA